MPAHGKHRNSVALPHSRVMHPYRLLSILLPVLLLMPFGARALEVKRVEPPNWWIGFEHQELQLMLYGPGLAGATAVIDHPGVKLVRARQGDSPNYLFLYLAIAGDAPEGELQLRLTLAADSIGIPYTLKRRDPALAKARGFTPADAIYLITPDRFANGDSGNDRVAGMGDEPPDRQAGCGRHGGDIAGIRKHLDYVAGLGFTAVWLNPVLENRMPECSYHGYSTTDFYRVDPRFGSNADYVALVREARTRGLGTIMDMIVNHIGTGHWWMADLPTADWLNAASTRPRTNHAHATQYDPYVTRYDLAAFADGWFVDSMPDLNQRNVLLAEYLTQNAIWWIETLGLAGIRMDTYPYPDKHYMAEWTRRVMQEYPGFTVVGEEWSPEPAFIAYWQRGKQNPDGYVSWLPSLMDFPLQEQMVRAMAGPAPGYGSPWNAIYMTLASDLVYPDPSVLVIMPDNHDMDRIYTQLGRDFDLFRMSMVMMATLRGTPQILYGTEVLMNNQKPGDHGEIRSDFPGGWPGDQPDAVTGAGLAPEQVAAQELVRSLFNWRKTAPATHSGRMLQYVPDGKLWAYARIHEAQTVLTLFNLAEEPLSVDTERFAEVLGDASHANEVLTRTRVDLQQPLQVPARGALLLEMLPAVH